jgi:RimJ/RimL family protein N-acetyltransferase
LSAERVTGNLLVRPPRSSDRAGYRALFTDEAVNEWLRPPPLEPFGDEGADEMLSRDREHWKLYGYGPWVLTVPEGGAMVGRGGIQWVDLDGGRAAELPWTIASSHWGLGLATEAAGEALNWARSLELPGVVAFVRSDHPASLRVAEKAGLEPQGETVRAGLPHRIFGLSLR